MNLYSTTDRIPLVAFVPLLVMLVAVPCALGYLAGRRAALGGAKPEQAIGTIIGATLGLLAFMLAFMFNAAYGRHDTRRQLTMTEAAAIEMTHRTSELVPSEFGQKIQPLLSEYLEVRLRAVKQPETMPQGIVRCNELIDEMWMHARAAAREDPSSEVVHLFTEALSETTRLNTLRVMVALRSRTPPTIWLALILVVLLSMSGMGYQTGLGGTWRTFPLLLAIAAFTTIMALIADLDRPQEGLISVSQGALEDVRIRLFSDPPAQP